MKSTTKKGKHPFLKAFGKESLRGAGYALAGSAAGLALGAGGAKLLKAGTEASQMATMGGHQIGNLAGSIGAAHQSAKSNEALRKQMGIGGKKITTGRQLLMPGSIRLAYRSRKGK